MIRILLLADTHLGFDLPERPRVKRRRRGHDFLANYARALEPAVQGEVDVVVHAGDVFDHPHVNPTVAYQAFEPLRRIAEAGVPVFIVPGNHERSRLPHTRFAAHANIHLFDRARTFTISVNGTRLALTGFPYERRDVRGKFAELLNRAEWQHHHADVRLLCVHHCVEGARVGPHDFTFTTAADVIRINDVPAEFSAVFSGHIHRHQVLTADLRRRPAAVPVLYPGSIERTAFAEMGEQKGYLLVHVEERRTHWQFRPLPARPMIAHQICLDGLTPARLAEAVRALVDGAPVDAVLGIRCTGAATDAHTAVLSAAHLRAITPESMNVEVRLASSYTRRAHAHG